MMMELQEKLINVQVELKSPKDKYNSFGKYKYRSCESILEAVKPLCKKYGLLLTLSDSVEAIGNRVYVKATATVTSGSDSLSVSAYAREDEDKKGMDGSQITGSSSSYARKYALNGLFNIDDTQDADTDEYHTQTTQAPAPKKQEPKKQIVQSPTSDDVEDLYTESVQAYQQALHEIMDTYKYDINKVAQWKKKEVTDLTYQDLQDCLTKLRARG